MVPAGLGARGRDEEQKAKRAAQLQLRADLERQMAEQRQQREREKAHWKQLDDEPEGVETVPLGSARSHQPYTSGPLGSEGGGPLSPGGAARQVAWRERSGSMGGTLAGLGGGSAAPPPATPAAIRTPAFASSPASFSQHGGDGSDAATAELASRRQKEYRDELLRQAAEQKALRTAEKQRDREMYDHGEFLPPPSATRQQQQQQQQ